MGKSKKKAKGTTVQLSEFISNQFSWAEQFDDLPTEPQGDLYEDHSAVEGNKWQPKERYNEASFRATKRLDEALNQVELPTKPPYKAFIGGLPSETAERDIRHFFVDCKIVNFNHVCTHDGISKGYGFVEFEDLISLKTALGKSDSELNGKLVRVSLATGSSRESPQSRVDVGWVRSTSRNLSSNDSVENIGGYGNRGRYDQRGFQDRFRGQTYGSRQQPSRAYPEIEIPKVIGSKSTSEGKENPFGEAKPVDSQESVEINSEKAVSFSPEKSFTRGVLPSDAQSIAFPKVLGSKKNTTEKENPFGSAKPVDILDTTQRSHAIPKVIGMKSSTQKISPFGEAKPVDLQHPKMAKEG
ncbi:uncharacterized protein LOC135119563 isoform X2 [Zophobas morio]|jgi:RNA recognition motif-containing protein|uniref:uncharacterized protein LOC135119563 isoform X2 n=1 Tax=Zophobas morio TaxID=2755281 RepID=UPI003083CA25